MNESSGKSSAAKPPAIKTRYGTRDFGGYAQATGAGSAIKRALEERADEAKPSRGLDVILPTLFP